MRYSCSGVGGRQDAHDVSERGMGRGTYHENAQKGILRII